MSVNNIYTNDGATGLWSTAANWSLGHKPQAGEVALLDGTTDNNLVVDENAACDGICTTAAYDGDVDFGDSMSHAWNGYGIVMDHTGDVSLGTDTIHTVTDGTFDWWHVGGSCFRETSTVVMQGTCILIEGGRYLYTVKANATVTVQQTSAWVKSAIIVVDGAMINILSGYALVQRTGSSTIAGTVTGGGTYAFYGGDLLSYTGAISVAVLRVSDCRNTKETLPAGVYEAALTLIRSTNVTLYGIRFAAGAYEFEDFEIEAWRDRYCLVDAATNDSSVTLHGSLTIDSQWTEAEVELTIGTNAFILEGDLVSSGDGDFTISSEGGAFILSSTNDQNIDPCGADWSTIDIRIDKAAGTVTLDDDWTVADFTWDAGGLDLNGKTLQATGDIDIDGGTLADPVGSTLRGDAIDVDGVDMEGSGTWYLTADSAGTLHNLTVTNCDASGGVEINATDNCIDGGGNTNIDFGVAAAGTFGQTWVEPFAVAGTFS